MAVAHISTDVAALNKMYFVQCGKGTDLQDFFAIQFSGAMSKNSFHLYCQTWHKSKLRLHSSPRYLMNHGIEILLGICCDEIYYRYRPVKTDTNKWLFILEYYSLGSSFGHVPSHMHKNASQVLKTLRNDESSAVFSSSPRFTK